MYHEDAMFIEYVYLYLNKFCKICNMCFNMCFNKYTSELCWGLFWYAICPFNKTPLIMSLHFFSHKFFMSPGKKYFAIISLPFTLCCNNLVVGHMQISARIQRVEPWPC